MIGVMRVIRITVEMTQAGGAKSTLSLRRKGSRLRSWRQVTVSVFLLYSCIVLESIPEILQKFARSTGSARGAKNKRRPKKGHILPSSYFHNRRA